MPTQDLRSQVSAGREAVYELVDLVPHRSIRLIDLAMQLTHLEILLGRPSTLPLLARHSVAQATAAALAALDDLDHSSPLTATPFHTQLRCCRALFAHMAEEAQQLGSSTTT